MNISSRFSEFGMTGAFFWIAQLIYFAITHSTESLERIAAGIDAINPYIALISSLPDSFADIPGTLVTVIGLIGIFITGLILNLLGSYFFIFEDFLLNRHLRKNAGWLARMMGSCPGTVNDDYLWLRNEFSPRLYLDPRQAYKLARLTSACTRIQSFLFSYIQVFGGKGIPEMLSDQVHLWRTARAIGITFWLLALETLGFYLFDNHGSVGAVMGWGAGLFLLGIYTTLRPYNRMCHTLFTLTCATYNRQQGG